MSSGTFPWHKRKQWIGRIYVIQCNQSDNFIRISSFAQSCKQKTFYCATSLFKTPCQICGCMRTKRNIQLSWNRKLLSHHMKHFSIINPQKKLDPFDMCVHPAMKENRPSDLFWMMACGIHLNRLYAASFYKLHHTRKVFMHFFNIFEIGLGNINSANRADYHWQTIDP